MHVLTDSTLVARQLVLPHGCPFCSSYKDEAGDLVGSHIYE